MAVNFQRIIPFQEANKQKLTPFEEEIKTDDFISKLKTKVRRNWVGIKQSPENSI